jgi:signal transduction histidine kinase/CheY-like chemotaxis protein/ligand-binding sensor domain-containing protein
MRSCHTTLLIALLPGFLQAQTKSYSEPFLFAPPGIVLRMEKFEALTPAGNTQIYGFADDREGFLWCRTNKGLARFDGYDLKVYPEDLADTAGVFRTLFNAIAVDGDGFVWGGTANGGIKRLNPATGQSRWYHGRREDPTSIGTGATRLLVTSDGQLWAGAQYGLARYNRETDSFIRYNLPPDCPEVREGVVPAGYIITSLCELDRSIWVGLIGGGLAEFNRDSGVWKMYTHKASTSAGPSHDIVRAVCPDRTGRLWIGTRDFGLDSYDPRSGTWHHFSVSKDEISPYKNDTILVRSVPVLAIVEDHCGGIWISALGAGLFRFDPVTEEFLHFRHDSTDVNSLPYNTFVWIGATRFRQEGESASAHSQYGNTIVWAPFGVEGSHRVIVRKDPCTSVVIPPKEGAMPTVICALSQESPDKIWGVQFNGRLGFFDLRTRMVRWHPDALGGIYRLCQLRDKTLLVSTRGFKAWTFDAQRDHFVPFIPDLNITCFLEENDSLLWLGCKNALGMSHIAAVDRRTGRYTVYPRQDSDSASHFDEAVLRMCNDGRGGLWYGTGGGGLIRFDLKQKTYRRYAGNPGLDNALIANGVVALIPDSAGRLWVGTNAGLALMDCDRSTFEHVHSGLRENSDLYIRDMVDDGEGHLWIASHEGAVCFTKATRTFRMLTPPAQFRTSPIWGAMFEPQTRTVTFSGAGGFFMFSIDDPPRASAPPPVVLTSFRVFEKPYPLDAEIWSLKSITLPHSATFFSFTFAALDYINSAKNQYAYQLEGLDPGWVQAGSRRYVSYSNLDPGTYMLRVRGADSEGIWNEKGTAIEIVVLPPWYRTVWAYGAYLLAFGGLLFLLRTFDRRRVVLRHSLEMKSFEAAKMHEVDQMKSRFFANISHEFRTPLTLILGPIEQLAERFTNDEQIQSTLSAMRRNGLRLLQLINQLLDLSRMDAGRMTVHVRPLDLVALSRGLVMSFLSLADRKNVHLIFDPEEDEIIAYTDRDKFEKILTNLISNAFKFTGEGGEIWVILRILNGEKAEQTCAGTRGRLAELVVSDTGVGIEATHIGKVFDRFYQVEPSQTQEHGGTGIGLALAKELVEILKGEITVESTPGHGSTFVVRFPLGKEEWGPEEIATEERISGSMLSDSTAAALIEGEGSRVQESLREPGKPVVLIVEDNADVRTYVRGFLQKHYTVEEAENGKTGLEKARQMGIDLVISDLMMPVMDGLQLCRELKGDDRTSHIPVVLVTARATPEGKLDGLDLGADDYVVKPFDARELMARVKNLIDTRRKLWEKYHQQVTLGSANALITSTDGRFLKRLTEYIERHVADANYDTKALAHDMCISRMQLNRKLKALTGRSTHEVVREFRLQRAAELLRNHADSIAGVAYDVGFNSSSHFALAFRERFGVAPSEYGVNDPQRGADVKPGRRN